MNVHVIHTGFFKLDGGAMFGVVPKSIWNKLNPADENNLCTWAMRSLLVEHEGRVLLIDNGIGSKQDQGFLRHYHLHGDHTLKGSLHNAGFQEGDVTDMFLTHLHFDHCGGGVERNGADAYRLTFPNATYWSHSSHWQWATQPNAREKASFLKENILPMQDSGHLRFTDQHHLNFPGIDIFFAHGHTDHMMIPMIRYKSKVICFMADLIPSVGHLPLPYLMAYDTRPLMALDEKKRFLDEAAANGYILFFEHDPVVECCTVKQTEKGVRMDKSFPLSEVL